MTLSLTVNERKYRPHRGFVYIGMLCLVLSYEHRVRRYEVPTWRHKRAQNKGKKISEQLEAKQNKLSTSYFSFSYFRPPSSLLHEDSNYCRFTTPSISSSSSPLYASQFSPSYRPDADEEAYNDTIYSFLKSHENDFQLWTKCLDLCELSSALNLKEANYTVFACTDEAIRSKFGTDLDDIFSGYLFQVNQTLISLLPQIASYHIINGTIVNIDAIQDKYIKYDMNKQRVLSGTRLIPTVNGNLVIVSSNYMGEITVNNIEVAKTAFRCRNGLVYVIDSGVLMPKFSNATEVSGRFSRKELSKEDETSIKDSKTGAIKLFQIFLRLLSRKAGSIIDGKLAGDIGFDPHRFSRYETQT